MTSARVVRGVAGVSRSASQSTAVHHMLPGYACLTPPNATLVQQKPCELLAFNLIVSLASGALFLFDMVSDIIVLVELSQSHHPAAGAFLAFGIIFL